MEYGYLLKYHNNGCFIQLQSSIYYRDINTDSDIAKFLGMSLEEYRNILIQFNGIIMEYSMGFKDMFFDVEEDCQKAINYLYKITDQCLVIKELIGE